jgi:hypothetical protein
VSRIRRRIRARAGPLTPGTARGGAPGPGLVGRITVTIGQDTLTSPPAGPGPPAGIAAAVHAAAARSLARALAQADADADADAGGCAHHAQSAACRPPPRLRDYITARDLTCRNPICRQPAWRADLDHTIPWDQGGRTCACNLGGVCRHRQDGRFSSQNSDRSV